MRQQCGFTLLETVIVIAIVAVVSGIAAGLYRGYLSIARDAQTESNIETIRETLRLANAEHPEFHYAHASQPGKAPPELASRLDDRAFLSTWGVNFRLMDFPPGFFPAYPGKATYGLVATPAAGAGVDALDQVEDLLPSGAGHMIWLSESELAFPLLEHDSIPMLAASAGVPQPVIASPLPPTAVPGQVPVPTPVVAPQPLPPIATPGLVESGTSGTSAGAGAAANTGTGSAAGATVSAGGDAGSTTAAAGGVCPPGYLPAGNSGHCHPDHSHHH